MSPISPYSDCINSESTAHSNDSDWESTDHNNDSDAESADHSNAPDSESTHHDNDPDGRLLVNLAEVAWQVHQPPERPTGFEHPEYSEVELITILQDRKAVGQRVMFHTINPVLSIRDFGADEEIDPIGILKTLGVDLAEKVVLGARYFFFSKTRYLTNRPLVTRDRSMTTSYGPCCWSQGGGAMPVIDQQKRATIGVKRKFTFFRKPASNGKKFIQVGSSVYGFQLQEFAIADDEEKEKRMMLMKQRPLSFTCLYKLLPIMISTAMEPEGESRRAVDSKSLCSKDQLRHQNAPESPLGFPEIQIVPADSLVFKSAEEMAAEVGPHIEPISAGVAHGSTNVSVEANDTDADKNVSKLLEELYSPKDWNSPELLFIPGNVERHDQQWMGPFKRS